MGLIESPIFWIVLAAVSEILAAIPNDKLKSNSLFQLATAALTSLLKDRKKKVGLQMVNLYGRITRVLSGKMFAG